MKGKAIETSYKNVLFVCVCVCVLMGERQACGIHVYVCSCVREYHENERVPVGNTLPTCGYI